MSYRGKPVLRRAFGGFITQTPYDGEWVRAIKACIPERTRTWDSLNGVWTFECRYFEAVKSITLDFHGEVIDSTGGLCERTKQDEEWRAKYEKFKERTDRRSSHSQGRASTPMPKRTADPFAVLHLRPDAPREVVKAAHRALCKLHHPDVGGGDQRMQDINEAYALLQTMGVV